MGLCRYRHNPVERALRPIPLGKKNWLFTSSEVGAQRVGIIRSLLVTCRLHAVRRTSFLYLRPSIRQLFAGRFFRSHPQQWYSLFDQSPVAFRFS